jgi:hypothetical protein
MKRRTWYCDVYGSPPPMLGKPLHVMHEASVLLCEKCWSKKLEHRRRTLGYFSTIS